MFTANDSGDIPGWRAPASVSWPGTTTARPALYPRACILPQDKRTPHRWKILPLRAVFMRDTDIRTMQELLGHSDLKTTMIYAHTVPGVTLKEAKSPRWKFENAYDRSWPTPDPWTCLTPSMRKTGFGLSNYSLRVDHPAKRLARRAPTIPSALSIPPHLPSA